MHFAPDEHAYMYLTKTIGLHRLHNVSPVRKALAGSTGTAQFCMDGSLGAGLSDYLQFSVERLFQAVSTISLSDAWAELGEISRYVKTDIEGVEAATVEGTHDFLKARPIHFSIESDHLIKGERTCKPPEQLFKGIGYSCWSSDEFDQLFTWAEPPG
jgi:FkbM family methyltransferase